MNTIKNEPVVTVTTVTGLVMAFIALLMQLNVFEFNVEQLDAVENFITLAVPFVFVASGLIARQFVTPNNKLR